MYRLETDEMKELIRSEVLLGLKKTGLVSSRDELDNDVIAELLAELDRIAGLTTNMESEDYWAASQLLPLLNMLSGVACYSGRIPPARVIEYLKRVSSDSPHTEIVCGIERSLRDISLSLLEALI